MVKSKSSASSATRKKHAKKALTSEPDDAASASSPASSTAGGPAQRGQKKVKKSRFEPKVKSYIPPPAAPKGTPDPVDLYLNGGAGIDSELVVILRKLGKRDEATISKGVEGVDTWTREIMREETAKVAEEDAWKVEGRRDELISTMAVWAHHFPRLALHPSRRLRLQTLALHTLLTCPSTHRPSILISSTRSALLAPQWTEQKEYVGAWCCAAFDGDRAVRSAAKRGWEAVVLTAGLVEGKEGIDLLESAEGIMEFASMLVLQSSDQDDPDDDPSLRKAQASLTIAYLLETLPAPLTLGENFGSFFTSVSLWELVRPEEPAALRRAIYELLRTIVSRNEVDILAENEGVKTVAGRVLRFCWSEDEGWAGVIMFLRRYQEAWILADEPLSTTSLSRKALESGSDDSDSDEEPDTIIEEEAVTVKPVASTSTSNFTPSPTLALFFTHLTLACTGHPETYPTILLLLATIPASVLPPSQDAVALLFESFWAAWGGRALAVGMLGSNTATGPTAVEEFVKSLLECLNWECSTLLQAGETEVAEEIAEEWVGRVWSTYLGTGDESAKTIKGISTAVVAKNLETTLGGFISKNPSLYTTSWNSILSTALSLLGSPTSNNSLPPLSSALAIFTSSTSDRLAADSSRLASDLLKEALQQAREQQNFARISALLVFAQALRPITGGDAEIAQLLDTFSTQTLPSLISSGSSTSALSFLASQLSSASAESANATWTSLFTTGLSTLVLLAVLKEVESGNISTDLVNAGVDDALRTIVQSIIDADGDVDPVGLEVATILVKQPLPFVHEELPIELIRQITDKFSQQVGQITSSQHTNLSSFAATATIISSYCSVTDNARALVGHGLSVVSVFVGAELLIQPRFEALDVLEEAATSCKLIWSALMSIDGSSLIPKTMLELQRLLIDPTIKLSPIEIVNAASVLVANQSASLENTLATLLPSAKILDDLHAACRTSSPSPFLSILDPIIPNIGGDDDMVKMQYTVDAAGLSSYARAVLALLEVSSRDHVWMRQNVWVLPHVLLVGNVARDELAVEQSTHGLFGRSIDADLLARLVASADGFASYLLSSLANELPSLWQTEAIGRLRTKEPLESNDLAGVMEALGRDGKKADAVYSRRAFALLLGATLKYSENVVADAERWLAYAQALPEGSELACAIIISIKPLLFETPRFERYQNELASILAGVPSSAASGKGLHLLRILLATAPPLDEPIIFLPQQRTMFLIQRMQAWISSDDDLADEIHTAIAELFLHLAPIVQELSGSHWDFMFDIIESNLETADWTDNSSLPALYQSARLLEEIKDLASSNADLLVTAKSRIDKSLELVRDLFISRPTTHERNQPRSAILEILARLVKDLPEKLLTMGLPFDQLLRLLQDPTLSVQQSAFGLVSRIAAKHVTDLVVEAELDEEQSISIKLPAELLELLMVRLDEDILDDPSGYHKASTYLFACLTLFTFFQKSSPRIKSAYITQLLKLDLVATSLLPSLFVILRLSDRTRPFNLSPWVVDDFRIDLLEDLTVINLSVFAAFVYYRALQSVPSLIRSEWEDIRNKQKEIAVTSFTSTHFSPLLINAELRHLRDPNDPAGSALRDNEDFTVRVAVGANEVKAVYVIDEQKMEVGLRIPSEYPLVAVEIINQRKVGVSDEQWRAWIVALKQVVTIHNGLIADGLSLFKRSVALHFEGVEACAICYSVIHVIDISLPTKACRTCHNRFHAGCLYKWFASSHGSSCPLCRSLF